MSKYCEKKYAICIFRVMFLMLILAVLLVIDFVTPGQVNAKEVGKDTTVEYKYMNVQANVKSFTETELKWNKHSVDEYVVYQTDQQTGKQTKLRTLSGTATSCKISTKKNKEYSYEICGIKYKKGTRKQIDRIYSGYVIFYSGLSQPRFSEYNYVDGEISPDSITIEMENSDGMKIEGYQLFCKEGNGSYEKIKTIKTTGNYTYIDQKVTAGSSYIYKVRTFKTIGGKKYFSKCSDEMKRNAVWKVGKYQVSGAADGTNPILKITSDAGNADLRLTDKQLKYSGYFSKKEQNIFYFMTAYSRDGKKWTKIKGTNTGITVKAGQRLYLKLEARYVESEDEVFDYVDYSEQEGLVIPEAKYNGFTSFFMIDPYSGQGRAYTNGEYYH